MIQIDGFLLAGHAPCCWIFLVAFSLKRQTERTAPLGDRKADRLRGLEFFPPKTTRLTQIAVELLEGVGATVEGKRRRGRGPQVAEHHASQLRRGADGPSNAEMDGYQATRKWSDRD